MLGFLGTASFTFGLVRAVAGEVPSCDPERQKAPVNSVVYASNGETVLAVLRGNESRTLVDEDDVAPLMKQAMIAIEDRRFLEHRGVDMRAIGRALWADLRHKGIVEGGSTITQQFVKNTCGRNERSIARKVREAALAWQVEQQWPKGRILTAYLNTIYFGNGAYGVQQASMTYFGHGAGALELHEAALLAGIPADPTLYDPVRRPRQARARRGAVLDAMLEQGLITRRQHATASRAPLPRAEDVRLPGTQTDKAPYFTNFVREQLLARYGAERVFGGGLRVTTSIDLELQERARAAIRKWLPDEDGPSAALVAIDPRDGSVKAMVGGRNFRESQFNLAAQSRRQPGSTFKPFVLAAALRQGISPSTTLVSQPIDIPLGDRIFPVRNYEDEYLGLIDIEEATVHSDNSVYAQLTRLVTPRKVAQIAHQLGVTSPLNDYFAIGLGVEEVNPLEMARAFSSFANGGVRIDGSLVGGDLKANSPRAILHVEGLASQVDNQVRQHRALDENQTAIINGILQRVVRSGTGKLAALPDGRPVAGKTGTTDNYGDAWFVGYTPQLVTAVWVGYPDRLRPMLTEFHGEPVAGGTFPAQIWKSFMERALPLVPEGRERKSFAPPTYEYASPREVVLREGGLALDNGFCSSTISIMYLADRAPRRVADCKPNEVDVPDVVGSTLAAAKATLAAQPLVASTIFRPARPGQKLGVVVGQIPRRGTLSSYDEVKLVLPKAEHGVVPKVVGLRLNAARAKLRRAGLDVRVTEVVPGGKTWTVVEQRPRWRVAAGPETTVTVTVSRGSAARSAASAG